MQNDIAAQMRDKNTLNASHSEKTFLRLLTTEISCGHIVLQDLTPALLNYFANINRKKLKFPKSISTFKFGDHKLGGQVLQNDIAAHFAGS